MPELQTQTHSPRPANGVDLTKLRRFVGSGLNTGEGDGLVDAFAEVFAAMSVVQPAVATPVESTSQADNNADQESVSESDDTERESDDGQESSPKAVQLDAPVAEVTGENEAAAVIAELGRNDDSPLESDLASEIEVDADPAEISTAEQIETDDAVDETPDAFLAAVQNSAKSIDLEPTRRRSSQKTKSIDDASANSDGDESPIAIRAETADVAESASEANELGFTNQSEAGSGNEGESSRRRSHRNEKPGYDHAANADNRAEQADTAKPNQDAEIAASKGLASKSAAESITSEASLASAAADNLSSNATTNSNVGASVVNARSHAGSAPAASDAAKTASSNVNRSGGERPADVSRMLDSSQNVNTNADGKTGVSKSHSTADILLRAKLVQRVSKAFQHFGSEGGNIRLKLAPAELGSVRVEMNVRDKKVQARVVAETDRAAQLLREQLPELRGRLEAQGMQVDQISVERESETSRQSETAFDQGGSQHEDDANSRSAHHERASRHADQASTTRNDSSPSGISVSQSPLHVGSSVDLLY